MACVRVAVTMRVVILLLVAAVVLQGNASAKVLEVHSYGAKGDGVSDDTAAINKAISALRAGWTLQFDCGTYLITSGLTPITANHVVVTAPRKCATIKSGGPSGFATLQLRGGAISRKYPLHQDAPEGARQVVGDMGPLGVKPGDYLVVSDDLPGSAAGNQQVVKVESVSRSVAGLVDPLCVSFQKENGAALQKIDNPITATVSNLIFDGGSKRTNSNGLTLDFAVNSSILEVTTQNYAEGAITVKFGYGNAIRDTAVKYAGDSEAAAVDVYAQSRLSMEKVTVTNGPANGFGMVLHQVNRSTLVDITVAQNGAKGRAFKLYRSNYNTTRRLVVSGAGDGKNGISVTTSSSHNLFEDSSALNNTGLGIATFGDGNTDNTFVKCVAKYNTSQQFFQMPGTDDRTTIVGGEFCCNRGPGSPVISVNSHDFSIRGARIWDDNHSAIAGLSFGKAQRPRVAGNVFENFTRGADIDTGRATNGHFANNATPDGVTNRNANNVFVP